jgi:hypothetical protein
MWQTVMATTAAILDLRVYRLTTAGTGGTSVGNTPLDARDGAASSTAMSLPTVKGTEGAGIATAAPYMMQTIAVSSQLAGPAVVWDFDSPRCGPLVIPSGTSNGIAIKNINAMAGAQVEFVVWFAETAW